MPRSKDNEKGGRYMFGSPVDDYIDWDDVDDRGRLTEENFWQAVADMHDGEVNEFSDRDPMEFI